MLINKIDFFNKILEIYDLENHKYNEKIVDLILSKYRYEFDVYYDLFMRINSVYDIEPYYFNFIESKNSEEELIPRENPRIKKFSFYFNDEDDDISSICKELNTNAKQFKTCYSKASCKFEVNIEKRIIYVEISDIIMNIDTKKKFIVEDEEVIGNE
jgi:hypothetical protein